MILRLATFISRFDWVLLLLLLPSVIFLAPEMALLWLLIPVILGARRVATGRFLPRTPANLSLLLLSLMILVSTWATPDLEFSIGKVMGLVYGIVLFFITADVTRRGPMARQYALGLILLGGLGIVALSLLGTQWSSKLPLIPSLPDLLPERFVALPGALGEGFNPNQVAGVLLWVTMPALAAVTVTLQNRGAGVPRWLTWTAPLAALIFTALLILTQSRAGYLGWTAGTFCVLALALGPRWRRYLLAAGGVAAAVGALLLIGFGDAWLNDAGGLLGLTGGAGINSLSGRLEIWSRAIYGLEDFFFTGMGMNSFRRVVHILYPLFLVGPEVDIAHAHNLWLQVGLDLGVPGLIAYLALWLSIIGALGHQLRRLATPVDRALAIGTLGMLAATFFYGLFDTVSLGARPGFLFWAILGLAAGLCRNRAASSH